MATNPSAGNGFNSAGHYRDSNAFFKGKIGGKIVKKGVVEEKSRRINDNLVEQINKMDEFNIVQKDYI